MSDIKNRGYVNPDVLVSTDWVAEHLDDPKVRLVESNEDTLLYSTGHLPNAIHLDWTEDLNDPVRRDYLEKAEFEQLLSKSGIDNDSTVVFYGDKNNWWACYAFWIFKLFGHEDARVMDGGRTKWEQEDRELTKEKPNFPETSYKAKPRDDDAIRAFRDDVMQHIRNGQPLVDVRSNEEYTGERLHMPNYPNEGALRGGHIPGAANVPWSSAVNTEDGTFKKADELKKIYEEDNHLKPEDEVIAYCRIGERSSHTWFVLKYLLGYDNVKNYDGSWTEWGNLVGVPIEK